jgi:phosphatidylinositol alpha-1,6-mannosyltransferase
MADRPRLLIITPDFPPAPGGIQLMAHRIAAGMDALQTRVLTLDCPGAERFDSDGPGGSLRIERVHAGALPHSARTGLLNAAALRAAGRFRPDVTLSMHTVVSPGAAAIRRALGAPTVQAFYAEEIGARPKLAAFAVAQADAVIAISTYTAGLIAATGVTPARLALIPPGVDIPLEWEPQLDDRPTFLTIARMEERYKGHDVLVRSLALVRAKIPDVQWIVLGDGSLRHGIEQLARTYGVEDSIRFLGAVPDEQRDAWLRRAHLLAMPSRLPARGFAGEGFGIVYLEAGAYGKPVVAGAVGGATDAVLDNETGLLVDPLDPLAVAEAITRLLADPALAARLGDAGRRRAEEFAWPLIVERIEAVLLDSIAARDRRWSRRRVTA